MPVPFYLLVMRWVRTVMLVRRALEMLVRTMMRMIVVVYVVMMVVMSFVLADMDVRMIVTGVAMPHSDPALGRRIGVNQQQLGRSRRAKCRCPSNDPFA